jgi:aryl-alcohol dehydrogenase-like predicted oxidoreductase
MDYTYDAVMRSLEFSLERLGIDRVDILYAHSLDAFDLGSEERVAEKRANSWPRATARWWSCATRA